VSLAARKLNLSNNGVLSLSHVFVISKDQSDSSLHRCSYVDFDYLRSYLNPKEDWEKLPTQARLWCVSMDEVIGESDKFPLRAIRKLVRGFEDELDAINNSNDRLVMFCNILYNLVAAFGTWTDNISLKNAFTIQHLSPFIKEIFIRENITMRLGKTRICHNHLLLSDYVGSYQAPTGHAYDVLTVEIKPPKKSSDLVKVGKEMKVMIDDLVDLGIETPTVAGALLEGFTMTTYTMQLVCEGVYIMLERNKVDLLRSPGDISSASRITESLMQLANSVKGTIRDIHDRSISRDPHSNIQQDWKRPSAAVPKRITKRTKPCSSPSPSPSTSSSSSSKLKSKK
jgi:hypothetical protein